MACHGFHHKSELAQIRPRSERSVYQGKHLTFAGWPQPKDRWFLAAIKVNLRYLSYYLSVSIASRFAPPSLQAIAITIRLYPPNAETDMEQYNSLVKSVLNEAKRQGVAMKKQLLLMTIMFSWLSVPKAMCKDKPTITIQVVDTQTWQRQYTIEHAGSPSQTSCNSNGSTNGTVDGTGGVYATTNTTTNCTTTPGAAPYSEQRSITQESIHAILNGQHVLLWCQNGFRKCAALAPGTYQAEPDGNNAVKIYVYSLVTHQEIGKIKYRVAGAW
jgi:hypothetical protein